MFDFPDSWFEKRGASPSAMKAAREAAARNRKTLPPIGQKDRQVLAAMLLDLG